MIRTIIKYSYTGSLKYNYQIHYTSGRRVTYSSSQNLPMTAVEFMLNGSCETRYTPEAKIEYFRA